jgi:hypothetical protein
MLGMEAAGTFIAGGLFVWLLCYSDVMGIPKVPTLPAKLAAVTFGSLLVLTGLEITRAGIRASGREQANEHGRDIRPDLSSRAELRPAVVSAPPRWRRRPARTRSGPGRTSPESQIVVSYRCAGPVSADATLRDLCARMTDGRRADRERDVSAVTNAGELPAPAEAAPAPPAAPIADAAPQ